MNRFLIILIVFLCGCNEGFHTHFNYDSDASYSVVLNSDQHFKQEIDGNTMYMRYGLKFYSSVHFLDIKPNLFDIKINVDSIEVTQDSLVFNSNDKDKDGIYSFLFSKYVNKPFYMNYKRDSNKVGIENIDSYYYMFEDLVNRKRENGNLCYLNSINMLYGQKVIISNLLWISSYFLEDNKGEKELLISNFNIEKMDSHWSKKEDLGDEIIAVGRGSLMDNNKNKSFIMGDRSVYLDFNSECRANYVFKKNNAFESSAEMETKTIGYINVSDKEKNNKRIKTNLETLLNFKIQLKEKKKTQDGDLR
ncbi:MAG: hypothetical protein ACEPOV_02090 [Hyphomicrobiales bacterium]